MNLRVPFERGKERGWVSIIAECLADVSEPVNIARTEDKAATKLKRVFARFVLAETRGTCSLARPGIIGPQEVQQRG
jgi:hypothetical protein